MAIDVFKFPSAALAQAFEAGLLFHVFPAPYRTELDGATLTVRDDLGGQKHEHDWCWQELRSDLVDVGVNPLVSTIIFPTENLAQAFVGGLSWFSTAFINVALSGTTVTVSERRGDNENAGVLKYEYAALRDLIANYRATLRPESSA